MNTCDWLIVGGVTDLDISDGISTRQIKQFELVNHNEHLRQD